MHPYVCTPKGSLEIRITFLYKKQDKVIKRYQISIFTKHRNNSMLLFFFQVSGSSKLKINTRANKSSSWMSISICFIQFTKCLVLKHRLLSAKPVSAHYQVHEVTHAKFIKADVYVTFFKKDFNFGKSTLENIYSLTN